MGFRWKVGFKLLGKGKCKDSGLAALGDELVVVASSVAEPYTCRSKGYSGDDEYVDFSGGDDWRVRSWLGNVHGTRDEVRLHVSHQAEFQPTRGETPGKGEMVLWVFMEQGEQVDFMRKRRIDGYAACFPLQQRGEFLPQTGRTQLRRVGNRGCFEPLQYHSAQLLFADAHGLFGVGTWCAAKEGEHAACVAFLNAIGIEGFEVGSCI